VPTLRRFSTVDALASALRTRILDGELEPGARLREMVLTDEYEVARHTVRAALRALAAEGLVRIEPHRGASVAVLDEHGLAGLYELRAALEMEAAHLALERHGGRLPGFVRDAVANLADVCAQADPPWGDVVEAHNEVHRAIVGAAESERIARAYDALAGEMQLLVMQLRPVWSLDRMAADHELLIDELERRGPDALREHLRAGAESLSVPAD
jgi:DNA-binding GntR family transcriptional regulator